MADETTPQEFWEWTVHPSDEMVLRKARRKELMKASSDLGTTTKKRNSLQKELDKWKSVNAGVLEMKADNERMSDEAVAIGEEVGTLRIENPRPARCLTAIEARLACEVMGKRLPTPQELEAKIGIQGPSEWSMEMVQGLPVFTVRGGPLESEDRRLLATEFSPEVGYRCVVTF